MSPSNAPSTSRGCESPDEDTASSWDESLAAPPRPDLLPSRIQGPTPGVVSIGGSASCGGLIWADNVVSFVPAQRAFEPLYYALNHASTADAIANTAYNYSQQRRVLPAYLYSQQHSARPLSDSFSEAVRSLVQQGTSLRDVEALGSDTSRRSCSCINVHYGRKPVTFDQLYRPYSKASRSRDPSLPLGDRYCLSVWPTASPAGPRLDFVLSAAPDSQDARRQLARSVRSRVCQKRGLREARVSINTVSRHRLNRLPSFRRHADAGLMRPLDTGPSGPGLAQFLSGPGISEIHTAIPWVQPSTQTSNGETDCHVQGVPRSVVGPQSGHYP